MRFIRRLLVAAGTLPHPAHRHMQAPGTAGSALRRRTGQLPPRQLASGGPGAPGQNH